MANNDTDVNVGIGATGSYQSVLSTAISDFSNFWKSAAGGNDAKAASSGMDSLASKAGISSKALIGVGVAGAVVVGATAAIGVSAIKAATSYQDMTTQLVTGAGESEKNLEMVRQGILNVSSATGESATDAANGMYLIESAGYHGQAGLDVLKVAAEGAKVGNSDLQTTADAVTTVMHDYGLKANDAGQAMNFLVSTVANGKMHMDDLTGSMGKILPTASQLNIPLAQVGGAMASLTSAGVPANRAATALNETMLKMAAPTTAAVTAMQSVGLNSTTVGNTLTHQGLLPALQMVTDAVGKKFPVGSAQYMSAISTISGGVRGLTGVLGTTGKNMQTFIDTTDKISDATKKAGNSVQGWSLVQKDEKTKMDEAKQSIDNAKIALGEGLLPAVTTITKAISTVIKPIAEWIANHQKISAVILGSIGAFAALAIAVTILTAAVSALNVAALPWIALAVAIGFAADFIVTHWKQIQPALQPVIKAFRDDILPILKTIASFVEGQLKTAWDDIVNSFNKVKTALAPYKSQLEDLAKVIGVVLLTPILILIGVMAVLVGAIVGIVVVGARLLGWLAEAQAAFVKFASDLVGSVVSAVSSVSAWFGRLPGDIGRAVSGFGSLLYNAGASLINGLIQGIENTAGKVFDAVKDIGSKATSALKGVLKIFSPSQVFADIGQNVGLGFIQGIKGTQDAVAQATGQLGQVSITGAQQGTPSLNTNGLSSPGSISNTTANTNTTNSQQVSIQNLIIQAPNGATFQSIMSGLNQDSLNASKGLTVNGGAI